MKTSAAPLARPRAGGRRPQPATPGPALGASAARRLSVCLVTGTTVTGTTVTGTTVTGTTVTGTTGTGTTGTDVADLARNLRGHGHQVVVFGPNGPPGDGGGTDETSLRRLLWDAHADVVHFHYLSGGFPVRLIEQAWLSGARVVLALGPLPGGSSPGRSEDGLVAARHVLAVQALPFCDLVTVPSRPEAALIAQYSRAGARIEVRRWGASWEAVYDRLCGARAIPEQGSLSVVVATYNRAEELRRCLIGLTHQTLGRDRFEVVVVDDCSATPVEDIVAEFSGILRARLVRKTANEGLGEARRSGVEVATGDVTLFFDDDDVPRPDCLAAHLEAHAQHPGETDAVLGFTALHPDVQLNAAMEFALVSGQRLMSYPALQEGEVPWHCAWGGRTSYKTAFLRRALPRGRWLEDMDLNARLRHVGLSVWYTRNAVQYMTHELSISQLRSRARTLGMAGADVLARLADADLPGLLGADNAAERAREQAPLLPAIEDIIDQLSARPLEALSCLPATLNGQPTTAEQVLWAALNAVMDYENRLGFLVRCRQLQGGRVTGFAALPRWGDSEELARSVSVFATAFDAGDPAQLFLFAPATVAPPDALRQVEQVLFACGRAPEEVADVHVVPVVDGGALHGAGGALSELIWVGHPSPLGSAPPLALRADAGANDLRRLAGLAPRGGPAGLR